MSTLINLAQHMPLPAGTRYYTLKDDSVYYDCSEAQSFGIVDLTLYRGKNYRNELPAQYIGEKWSTMSYPITKDDRATATPPQFEALKDTFIAFMTGGSGDGNCVALIRLKDFEAVHRSKPTRY